LRVSISADLFKIRLCLPSGWSNGADAINPPSAGRKLLYLLLNASLHVIDGGDHAFAHDRAGEVAPMIASFLIE
jgi:pimeloyl-ACP methyl ester carboxylesterase